MRGDEILKEYISLQRFDITPIYILLVDTKIKSRIIVAKDTKNE
jgi:hypothetical protein